MKFKSKKEFFYFLFSFSPIFAELVMLIGFFVVLVLLFFKLFY
ncbi:MAG: hypothetical protein N3D73_00015 [Candidatus Diapherotrites archaeon]|nr:hypothetical protein [Candidatus Diapherotrites archaeon]